VLSVRPRIAELTFQLFGRNLHPELFETFHARTIERADYSATIKITSSGHVIEFRRQGTCVTEVALASNNPLPTQFCLMTHPLKGSQIDRVDIDSQVSYQTQFALEPVAQDLFWNYQKELMIAGVKEGLIHQFESSGRFGLGAFSYVHHTARDRSLKIQAIHTFPDDYAIVKSETRITIGD
jgi:hypothetical protein